MLTRRMKSTYLFCDGGIGSDNACAGAGAVLRAHDGAIIAWDKMRLPAMTNNEAEYAALLLGLDLAKQHRFQVVHCFLDSEIVIGQMQGYFSVHSARLRAWHAKACASARSFHRVVWHAIPRERNRLADALANEAMSSWPPQSRNFVQE